MKYARAIRSKTQTSIRSRGSSSQFRQSALSQVCGLLVVIFVSALWSSGSLSAQELTASNGAAADNFGDTVSLSGNMGIVGADRDSSGSAFVFRGLDTATGAATESARLRSSDQDSGNFTGNFADSVSLSGNTAMVGSIDGRTDFTNITGSAFVFRGLDTATGTVNESATLIASDRAPSDFFGVSVSLFGGLGLVGASGDDDNGGESGSVYVFQGLDSATGTVTESAKLIASDGTFSQLFGSWVSLSGTTGLVRSNEFAYVFRGLDTASGTVTESVKLTVSDGDLFDNFETRVSLSGNVGIVGASFDDDNGSNSGSAYVFRGLDTATGTITESVKLTASDGAANDRFGRTVSLSGNTGLVGSFGDDDDGNASGSAYVFRGLDTATGTITESVKLTASDAAASDQFGASVSLDGDRFLIGAIAGDGAAVDSGSAYTGTVSSMTTLDLGNTSRIVDTISFESRTDWVVGETTSSNHVTLNQGDTGKILESGAGIFIGANAGSNENSLTIAGILEANEVTVGAEDNFGNMLIFDATASHMIGEITLFSDNSLALEGEFTSFPLLEDQLGMANLFVSIDGDLQQVTQANFDALLSTNFDSGFTSFTAIAQPVQLCDVNMDGEVNFLDISPFISVLSSGTFQAEADCDENGVVNFLDISPFIAVLSGP